MAVNNFLRRYHHQIKLPSQPKGVDSVSGGLAVVACINEVISHSWPHCALLLSYHFIIEPWNYHDH